MGLYVEQRDHNYCKYHPGLLSVEADTQSWTVRDAGDWKLNPSKFQKICKYRETLEIDLFASTISHQLPTCIHGSWTLTAKEQMLSEFPGPTKRNVFPSFFLIGRVFKKIQIDNTDGSNSEWQTKSWYPQFL